MKELSYNGRTFDAQGRNGFFRQTGLEAYVRDPNFGEAGANKGEPPPAGATKVVMLSGLHARGVASGHLCVPLDQVPELIQFLQDVCSESTTG